MCVSGIQHTGHRTGPPQISGTGEHTPPLTHYSPPLYSPPHPPALLLSHTTPLTHYSPPHPPALLPSHTTPLPHYSPPHPSALLPSHTTPLLTTPTLLPHPSFPPSPFTLSPLPLLTVHSVHCSCRAAGQPVARRHPATLRQCDRSAEHRGGEGSLAGGHWLHL